MTISAIIIHLMFAIMYIIFGYTIKAKFFTQYTIHDILIAKYEGCQAIERMVVARGKEKGYNADKLFEDLLQ